MDERAVLGNPLVAAGRVRQLVMLFAQPREVEEEWQRQLINEEAARCVLLDSTDLLNRFIAHLLACNARLGANLTDQLLNSSEQRLPHTLLLLADCDEGRPGRCPLPDLPQEIIAEMVGTTRSRVNFFMGKFKKLGFIEENSGVLHVNPARLQSPVLEKRPGPSAACA